MFCFPSPLFFICFLSRSFLWVHCRQYSLAVKYYLLSLSLLPSKSSFPSSSTSSPSSSSSSSPISSAASSSYCCLGLTYHLQGINYDIAIDYYHKALALRPEDSMAADLLENCLEQSLQFIVPPPHPSASPSSSSSSSSPFSSFS